MARLRRKDVSDETVIRGVLRVLQREGPGFSLAQAGAEVGLSAARLVQRFGGRDGLVRAVFGHWGRASLAALEAVATVERPLAAYLDWVRAGLAEMKPAGIHQSLAWMQAAAQDPVLRRWYAEHRDRSVAALARLLRRAITAGELRPTDCGRLAERMSLIVSGVLVVSAIDDLNGAALADLCRRELAAALAPHRPARAPDRKSSVT